MGNLPHTHTEPTLGVCVVANPPRARATYSFTSLCCCLPDPSPPRLLPCPPPPLSPPSLSLSHFFSPHSFTLLQHQPLSHSFNSRKRADNTLCRSLHSFLKKITGLLRITRTSSRNPKTLPCIRDAIAVFPVVDSYLNISTPQHSFAAPKLKLSPPRKNEVHHCRRRGRGRQHLRRQRPPRGRPVQPSGRRQE